MYDFDVIIIGAGPAGMMAAITAAYGQKKVCLIEHNEKPGKKILVTGNGKCNITNFNITPDCYNSDSKESYFDVINKFSPSELVGFLNSIGLLTKEKNGYVYPYSEQASSVLDALRNEVSRLGIILMLNTKVLDITPDFTVTTDSKTLKSKSLIISCGSKCYPKTGSDGSGYELAKKMSHTIVPPVPALVQIRCKGDFFRDFAGVRVQAAVTLTVNDNKIINDTGELQLTDYGISGIPVFCISRFVKRELDKKNNPKIHINFMPDYNKKEVRKIISNALCRNTKIDYITALNGIFNKKLASVLIRAAGLLNGKSCRDVCENDIETICRLISDFVVIPTDTNGFDNAQVCAGGVSLDEVNLSTLESKKVKNLYFAGEILDVDGKCGGYNLQWAFSSGHLCGISVCGDNYDKN